MTPDSLLLRRWAHFGAARAPLWFARYAPAPIAVLLSPFLGRARRAVVEKQRLICGRRSGISEYVAATKTLIEYASCLTEALGASRQSAPVPKVEVRGGEGLGPLLSSSSGILVATAHVGPWEGAALALSERSERSVMLVMEDERDPGAARFEDEMRRGRGLGVVRLGRDPLAALPVLEHLQAGGIAAMQVDRPSRTAAVMTHELFGLELEVPEGPFRLALMAEVPILPVFAARLGFMRRLVVLGTPVWPDMDPGRPRRERLRALATAVLSQLEAHLREFPTQWFHFAAPKGTSEQGALRLRGKSRDGEPTKVA